VTFTAANGSEQQGLASPKLLAYAKQFYQCQAIKVVPLENDGGSGTAGTHFEKTVFFNEVMTGASGEDQIFSEFSWNVLADSGWYGLSSPLQDNYTAGKDMGCEWLQKSCFDAKN